MYIEREREKLQFVDCYTQKLAVIPFPVLVRILKRKCSFRVSPQVFIYTCQSYIVTKLKQCVSPQEDKTRQLPAQRG